MMLDDKSPVLSEPLTLREAGYPDVETEYRLADRFSRGGRVVVAISSDTIGTGDEEHGADLLSEFLQGLSERKTLPDEILIYHRGVRILSDGHPLFDKLRRLRMRDVTVKACAESLDFYKIKPAEWTIQPVSMMEITQSLMKADRVIRP